MMYMTEGINESLEKIFAAVIVGGIEMNSANFELKRQTFKSCMPKFRSIFTKNVFYDEYAFFYEVLDNYKSGLFTLNQLITIIENNRDVIETSPFINLNKWDSAIENRTITLGEKVEAFKLDLIDKFHLLSNRVVSAEEFELACNIYIDYFSENFMQETIQTMAMIMTPDGHIERKPRGQKVHYKGITDAQRFYGERVKIIRELTNKDKLSSIKIDSKWFEERTRNRDKANKEAILDFGIREIDEVLGKMRRTNLLGILGPPKGGKTRMAAYLACRALMNGLNVTVWPLEGTVDEWTSMITAVMIRIESGVYVDSKDILYSRFENDEIRQLVSSADLQLSQSIEKGNLSFITGTAYVEDFIEVLTEHYSVDNPYDVLIMDSPVNIMSKGRKGKVERISEAYMSLKDFVANKINKGVLGIATAQLKQDVVDYLRKHPEETIDVTAGGESAETVRTPDQIVGLFSNKDERSSGKMKIYSVGARHNEDFDDFYARCELGCCYFYSDPNLNI